MQGHHVAMARGERPALGAALATSPSSLPPEESFSCNAAPACGAHDFKGGAIHEAGG